MLDAHTKKLSCLGAVVIIVSPSNPQSFVEAVGSNVRALYDVDAPSSSFKKSLDPSALLSVMVLPKVKDPDEASGPSTGLPSGWQVGQNICGKDE